jgi:hypothetical protein
MIMVENGFRSVADYRVVNKKISIVAVPLLDIHSYVHWFVSAKAFI